MKRMIADLILVALLDISLCVPFAQGSEVIYQDENVLMEKVGQMIIKDANRIFWRADEIPDAELKDLCDMAVVVEKDPANGKTTVLYPFLLYSGDYQKHTTKFINYKGEVLREEHDLDLESAENFSSEIVMSKGSTKQVVSMLWVFDYKGNELYKVPIEVYPQSFMHSAPQKHVAVWRENWRFVSSDYTGGEKTVLFGMENSSYTTLRFSNDGKYAAYFGRQQISVKDYLGNDVWTTQLGFKGVASEVFLSSDNNYILAYYVPYSGLKPRIMLFNNFGKISDTQVTKNLGVCGFYESMNQEYMGVMYSEDGVTTIYHYQPSKNFFPKAYQMQTELTNQAFKMDSQYPSLSTNDGRQIVMVKPNRACDERKAIIRITLKY